MVTYEASFLQFLKDSGYFSPEYQGDTEEYYRSQEVAKCVITLTQINALNLKNPDLLEGILAVRSIFKSQVDDTEYLDSLLKQFLDESVIIERRSSNTFRSWYLKIEKTETITTSLMRIRPTITSVSGKAENLQIKIGP